MKPLLKIAGLFSLLVASAAAFADASLEGRWDAQLERDGTVIPFRLDIAGQGQTLEGTLYNGFLPFERTSSARFQGDRLELNLDHYLITIRARLENGKLVGELVSQNTGNRTSGFSATPHDASAHQLAATATAPIISGEWEIPLPAPTTKGERAFRFIVEQRKAEVSASFLRVDGDTGGHTGVYRDGKWLLSRYDGSRPAVIEVTPQQDGSLKIVQLTEGRRSDGGAGYEALPDGRYAPVLQAYRPEVAREKGFPKPANHLTHTALRDPEERFTFNFPDLDGNPVTQDDFEGRPIVAVITGTWCPNCHDEAQYLVELDRQYRDQGLAILALNFEEVEQQASLRRARAFVKQYGVEYPYLQAGAPEEMWAKVPQLLNLNTWPTTVFIGRDGTIRAVHAGFASPATGDFYVNQDKEFRGRVEQLLAEPVPADARVSQTD